MYQPGLLTARHETKGAVLASSIGTTITGDGSANVKGAWADLGSVTSFAYEAITLYCQSGVAIGGLDFMLDIGISDGSNRFILCSDLHLAFRKIARGPGVQFHIPVHVPQGAQLSARVASSGISGINYLTVVGHSTGLGGAPGFSRCVALFTPASSRGIAVDPGATANTKGSWAQITASSPEDVGAMFGMIGYNGDISRAAAARSIIDIGIGAASSEFVLYPNALVSWGATRDGPSNCPRIPLFAANVAKTTHIAARSACSLNTAGDRTIDLALYGLVL